MDVFERVDYYLRGEMSAIDGFEKYKEHPEGREIYETLVNATKSNFERINHFNYNGKQVEKRALYYFLGKDFCNVENTLIDCDDVLSSFNETPIFKPLKIFLAEFNTSCFYGVAAMPWSCRRLTFSKKGDLTLRLMALVSDNSFPSHIIEKMIDVALIELKIVNNDKLINKQTTVKDAPVAKRGIPEGTKKFSPAKDAVLSVAAKYNIQGSKLQTKIKLLCNNNDYGFSYDDKGKPQYQHDNGEFYSFSIATVKDWKFQK